VVPAGRAGALRYVHVVDAGSKPQPCMYVGCVSMTVILLVKDVMGEATVLNQIMGVTTKPVDADCVGSFVVRNTV
jgi:hypothetical protein